MILGGVELYDSPIPYYSSPNWVGLRIKVNYSYGYNSTNNAPIAGDIIVDSGKRIWRVVSAAPYTTGGAINSFLVTVTATDVSMQAEAPDTSTRFGIISTPLSNGAILAPVDTSVTDTVVFKTAANYNMQNMQSGTGTGVTSGNDLIGLTIAGTSGQVLGVTQSGTIGLIPGATISNASALVGLSAPSGVTDGKVLGVSGGQLQFITPPSGGASTFTGLSDVPDSYTGMAGKLIAVNSAGTGIEFIDAGGIAYIEYPVNVTYNTGGNIEPHGIFNVSEGSNITFTITPETGYEIQGFTVNGVQQTIVGNSFTVSNINQTTYVVATFGKTGEVTINPGTFPPFDFAAVDTTKSVFAIGYDSIAMIGSDGNVYTRGKNDKGQLGDGTTTDRYNWGRIITSGDAKHIISETVGPATEKLYYLQSGTSPYDLYRWGTMGTLSPQTTPLLTLDGLVISVGNGSMDTDGYGELNPLTYRSNNYIFIANGSGFDASTYGITQSTLYSLAAASSEYNNIYFLSSTNKLIYRTQTSISEEVNLSGLNVNKIVYFTGFSDYTYRYTNIFLTAENDLYFVGYDGLTRRYWDEFNAAQTIATPTLMSHGKFKDVGISKNLVIAIENTTSYVHTWGKNARTNTIEYKEYPELGTCKAVYGGYDTVVAITNDNKVYIWGNLSMLDPNLTTWIDVPFRLNQ